MTAVLDLAPPFVGYLPGGSDLAAFQAWLTEDHGVIALDTETTGLDTRAPDFAVRLLSVGASDGTAWVVDGRDGVLVRTALTAAVRTGKRLWAHNATYDAAAIHAAYGVRLRGLRCSLVASKCLDPTIIGTGRGGLKILRPATQAALEALAAHWATVSGTTTTCEREHAWLPDAVRGLPADDPVLLHYAAVDAVECARLMRDWVALRPAEERQIALTETTIEDLWRWPAARGYRVDIEMLHRELAALESMRRESVERWGLDLTSSSNATREWVARRGIRITDHDGKGTLAHRHCATASVPEDVVEDWKDFLRIRQVARTANKLNEISVLVGEGDRLHPQIRAIGAHTGRMSIGKPALQNLTEGLRGLLLAEPGMVLVGCDLDRVEPCVIAALSGDEALIEAVRADVYTELAVSVFGEGARGDLARRSLCKTAFLAMIYGQGAPSLSRNLGIAEVAARDVITGIRAGYPGMSRWMSETKWRASRGQLVFTAGGRRLPSCEEAGYRAVNWAVQGSAADIFKTCTMAAAAALPRDALWLPVHDELIVQVPAGSELAAAETLRAAMTTTLNGVPITGTPLILGERWCKA